MEYKKKISISIHALVKRATMLQYKFPMTAYISIHALVKRATVQNDPRYSSILISIHALVKRATLSIIAIDDGIVISIHALVKRATEIFYKSKFYIYNFNPRPREEGDVATNTGDYSAATFQSTPS